jgi:hypothetical protein
MAFENLETHEMLEVVRRLPLPFNYFLQKFFPRSHTSQSETIEFDLVDKDNRLAPFVAPNVQGQPMVQSGFRTRKFKPAYLKPKDPVDPARLVLRQAGEAIGGNMTLQQREDAIVADILNDHNSMIRNRWEWMGARAVIDGSITIEGENYPRVTLAFGRHADHTITLLAGAGWNEATGTPLDDIAEWSAMMFINAGVPLTDITFSPEALSAFLSNPQVVAMMETRRGSTMSVESSPGNGEPFRFVGRLPNGTALWEYNAQYKDNNGTLQRVLAAGEIVFSNPGGVRGVQAFGAIMDRRAQYQSLPIFPKMWESEDPSGLFLMTQSAPLMVPMVPNATGKAQVIV